ncbi:hypothetical protein AAG570_013097 [Ranatra chinensis]|uniref:PIPK domain-containing protein n=1 Tax=Ranatra chinensis TaxID=642074 RepID=A0ABD0YHP8_9HEMI
MEPSSSRIGGDAFLKSIVTGDETWVSHYTPENKRRSMQWKHTSFSSAIQFKVVKFTKNIMVPPSLRHLDQGGGGKLLRGSNFEAYFAMNVSQGEYAKMMEVYLNRVSDRSFLPRLHTFQHSGDSSPLSVLFLPALAGPIGTTRASNAWPVVGRSVLFIWVWHLPDGGAPTLVGVQLPVRRDFS